MRTRTIVLVVPVAALACSGSEPSPTEARPQFATCTTKPTITPSPSSVTVGIGSFPRARFQVKNNCASSSSGPWDFLASRTGQVASVGSPSPGFVTLSGGQIQAVFVPYKTAAAGSGTVVLTAINDSPPITTVSASQSVTVSAAKGVPFGPYDLINSSGALRTLTPFNLTLDHTDPSTIISHINLARANKVRFVPQMTGGSHSNYLEAGKFSFTLWKNRQDQFNTQAIKDAIAAAVADGTVIFAELIDEPHHGSWGGNITHALLDQMSRHTKSIFPTLKTGVVVQWDWHKTDLYQSVDLIVSQYGYHQDQIVQRYRDSAVASAKRQNVGLMFSMNILNGGGLQHGDAPMNATQLQMFGSVLVSEPFACGLTMWTWNDAYMSNTANKNAFSDVATTAATRPAKVCGK